ncbi:MAG: hypothetical protein Q7R87_03005 [Nanoarchaeota archaeon]|nr:hypothetical protein [Nanoarchaeota archaeon]
MMKLRYPTVKAYDLQGIMMDNNGEFIPDAGVRAWNDFDERSISPIFLCHNGKREFISLGKKLRLVNLINDSSVFEIPSPTRRSKDEIFNSPQFSSESFLALNLLLAERGVTVVEAYTTSNPYNAYQGYSANKTFIKPLPGQSRLYFQKIYILNPEAINIDQPRKDSSGRIIYVPIRKIENAS